MSKHLQHGVPRICVGLVVDRTPHGQAELRAELGLYEPVGSEGFLRVVGAEICLATSCRNPHCSQGCSTPPWRRRRKFLYRPPQSLPNNGNGGQCDKTIVVVFVPT